MKNYFIVTLSAAFIFMSLSGAIQHASSANEGEIRAAQNNSHRTHRLPASEMSAANTGSTTMASTAVSHGSPNKIILEELQKILSTEDDLRAKLDKRLTDALSDMQAVHCTSLSSDVLDNTMTRHEVKVSEARALMSENHLRIEFLNAFISELEKSGDIRKDAPKVLIEMSHRDLLAQVESSAESKTWLFEMNLSLVLKDVLESSENFSELVKQYIIYSSLRDPRAPGDFIKGRDYLGGRGKPVTLNTISAPDLMPKAPAHGGAN